MIMASFRPHSVAQQSGEARPGHTPVINSKLHPPDFKDPPRKSVVLRGGPGSGATPRTLDNAAREAEVLRVEPRSALSVIPSCSSLKSNCTDGVSTGGPRQRGLSQLQSPYVVCQERLTPPDRNIRLGTSVRSTATPGPLSSVVDGTPLDRRPRTIEEALKILDVEERDNCGARPSSNQACQSGVMVTLEPDALTEDEVAFQKPPDTTEHTLICGVPTQKIESLFIRTSVADSTSSANVARRATVEQWRNSEPEDEASLEKPLDVDVISTLTDGEPHADVQILVARSMKLTTIDTERGACDWKTFTTLSVLSLSHNSLTDISPLSVLAPTLKDINVNFNNLSDLSPLFSCTRLQHLTAAHNHVVSVVGIGDCKDIERLILFHNCLQGKLSRLVEHLSSLHKLQELDIDENPQLDPQSADTLDDRDNASLKSESVVEDENSAVRIQHLQSPCVSTTKKSTLRLLLANCPSLKIFGGLDVRRLRISAPTKADLLLTNSTRTEIASSVTGSQAKRTPPLSPGISVEVNPTLSAGQAITLLDKHGQESTTKCDPTGSIDNPQEQTEDASSDKSSRSENCFREENSDDDELEATSNLKKLKRHIRKLRSENRNMYALLEENKKLRRHIQRNQDCCSLALSNSDFAARCQSAQPPLQAVGRHTQGTLCSPSARPRTALPLKSSRNILSELQTTIGASRDSTLTGAALKGGALCGDATVCASTENNRAHGKSDPSSVEKFSEPARDKQRPLRSQSEDQRVTAVSLDKRSTEKPGYDHHSTQGDADNQQTTAALKWENGMLKQRLDRLVKYVQLLRGDLDKARLSGIQRIQDGAKSHRQAIAFPSCGTRGITRRMPTGSQSPGTQAVVSYYAGTRGRVKKDISEVASPPCSMRSRRPDAVDTSQSGSDDRSSSPSSTSEIVDEPQSPAVKPVPNEGNFEQNQAETALADASHRRDNSTEQHKSGECRNTDALVTSLSQAGVRANLCPAARVAKESGQLARFQLTLRRDDDELASLVERDAENLKAFQRELRDSEWMLSRPTSASSSVAQGSSRTTTRLGAPSKSRERDWGSSSSCGAASQIVTQQIARHRTTQENLFTCKMGSDGYLPPDALAKDKGEEAHICKTEKAISKHVIQGRRSLGSHQQHSTDSVIATGVTGGVPRIENSGNATAFKAQGQKFLAKAAREKKLSRQSSMRAPGETAKPIFFSTLTETFSSTATRSRCTKQGGSGVQGSEPSRQPPMRCILPPLSKKTSRIKGSLE